MLLQHAPTCRTAFSVRRPTRAQRQRTHNLPVRTAAQATSVDTDDRVPKWEMVWKYLRQQNDLKSVTPQEAKDLAESNEYIIVDVRPRNLHEQAAIKTSGNAPLFQAVDWSKPSFTKALRAAALLANGVTPVEPNPDFLDDLRTAAGGKGVILACEGGGSTESTASFQWGKASRSLTAAYRVMKSQTADPVVHLKGGVYGWYKTFGDEGFDGTYDTGNIGRTPSAAGSNDSTPTKE